MNRKMKILGLGLTLSIILLGGCGSESSSKKPNPNNQTQNDNNNSNTNNNNSNTNGNNGVAPTSKETRCVYGKTSNLYEKSYVAYKSSPKKVLENCGFGTMCVADKLIQKGKPHCARSVDNEEATYRDFSCTFIDWLRFPTKLDMDCRCRRLGDGQGGAGGTGTAFADPNDIDVENGARPGGPIINCVNGGTQQNKEWPVAYGTGPTFSAWFKQSPSGASWFSGVFRKSSREMFGVVRWSNPTISHSSSIVAINIDTNVRRIVSGLYPDRRMGQVKYGSGYLSPVPRPKKGKQILTGLAMMKLGKDGMLYVFGGGTGEGSGNQRQITKVDPDSGKRTLMWEAMDMDITGDISTKYGQCFRPDAFHPNTDSVGLVAQGFEVGPNGEFYLSMHDVRAGDGILKISADGKTCTPISVWLSGTGTGHQPGGNTVSVPAYTPKGEGKSDLQFPIHGLLYYDDPKRGAVIFGVENSDLISFKIDDGFRMLESYNDTTYGGMGYSNMFFEERDGHRLVWAVGTIARYVGTVVDLDNGHREPIYGDTNDYRKPILKSDYGVLKGVGMGTMLSEEHSIGYGGFIIDPANPDMAYFFLKSGGVGKLELSTFNNYVYSY